MEASSSPLQRPDSPARRRLIRLGLAPASPIVEGPHAVSDVLRRDRRYRRALAVSDMAVSVAVLAAAGLGWLVLLVPPLVVLLANAHGLYHRDELLINKTTIDEAPQVFGLATLFALGLSLADRSMGAGVIVVSWLALFAVVLLARRATRDVIRRLVAVERCVLVGDHAAFARLERKLDGAAKAELVGQMTPAARPVAGSHDGALRELLDRTGAHRVIIDPSALPAGEMVDLVRTAKALGVRVSLLPSVHDVVGSEVVFDQLDGMTLLGVRRFGLSRSARGLKRAFDLAGAGLLMLAAGPVMAAIALAIKLDSRGPVFFRQTRVGRGGRHFEIYKFRTMVADAEARKASLASLNEAEGLFKIAEDPRITRVGRLLRRTSLDELAQLINVLRGDMSLVGPRPLIVDEDALITGTDRNRLELTPGMTGHWQIAGSARVPLHEMVKIDYLYVAGWSLWSDVKILLRTIPYMMARRGM